MRECSRILSAHCRGEESLRENTDAADALEGGVSHLKNDDVIT